MTDTTDDTLWLLMTTTASEPQARELAQAAVQARLAACAQISAIASIYRWQGQMQQEAEWRVLFKTMARARFALQALLTERHPYELPAIVGWPCGATLPAFAQWVVDEVQADGLAQMP